MANARTDERKRSGAMRVFVWVGALVLILAVVGTAAWFYLARELDARVSSALDAAAGGGTTINCPNREVFGYPFRIGLHCDSIAVESASSGIKASAGALRTAAQIYDPTRIVGELDGPLLVDAPNLPPLEMTWELAQASTNLFTQGLMRMSLAVDQPALAIRSADGGAAQAPLLTSQRLEIHLARNGETLLAALSDDGVAGQLPNGVALPSLNVLADVSVDSAGDWLVRGVPGGRLDEALRGRSGQLRNVSFAFADNVPGSVALSGPFQIAADGRISGDFRLAVADADRIAGAVNALVPGLGGVMQAVAGAITFAGRQENGTSVIDVQVRNGEMRLGFIPLGRLPPI
jgi:hypothetical protein